MSWRPTGKLQTVYATCLDDIEREAPKGTERDTWIAQKHAELKEEQRRLAEASRNKLKKEPEPSNCDIPPTTQAMKNDGCCGTW